MKKMTLVFCLITPISDKPEIITGGLPEGFKVLNCRITEKSDIDLNPVLHTEILCEFPIENDGPWNSVNAEFMLVPVNCTFDTKPSFTQWFNDKLGSMSIEERKSCIMPQSREEYVYVTSYYGNKAYSLYQKVYEFSVFDLNR